MKPQFVLVAIFLATAAFAQSHPQNRPVKIQTALNHFSVIDLEESVTLVAVADRDNYRVEQHGELVFVEPTKSGVSTDLFIKTRSRNMIYDIEPAGEVSQMTRLIEDPPASRTLSSSARKAAALHELELKTVAVLALRHTLIEANDISAAREPYRNTGITIQLEQILRTKGQVYFRYSISNLSDAPFRVTAPDLSTPTPTRKSVSLTSLIGHQLNAETFASFRCKEGSSIQPSYSALRKYDLAPGQNTVGVIGIPHNPTTAPRIYELTFGIFNDRPLTAEVVF